MSISYLLNKLILRIISCFFDGKDVITHAPSLGFLIDDIGSGNYFGKKIINLYFNNLLPQDLTKKLEEKYETVFLATHAHHSFLSSSVVKEVARYGGEISHMVPEVVAKDLKRLFN